MRANNLHQSQPSIQGWEPKLQPQPHPTITGWTPQSSVNGSNSDLSRSFYSATPDTFTHSSQTSSSASLAQLPRIYGWSPEGWAPATYTNHAAEAKLQPPAVMINGWNPPERATRAGIENGVILANGAFDALVINAGRPEHIIVHPDMTSFRVHTDQTHELTYVGHAAHHHIAEYQNQGKLVTFPLYNQGS